MRLLSESRGPVRSSRATGIRVLAFLDFRGRCTAAQRVWHLFLFHSPVIWRDPMLTNTAMVALC
jgi:hypothetical protein